MSFVRFVIKNALRNKRRAALTAASVAVSLFLLIVMSALMSRVFKPPQGGAADLRLAVRRSTGLIFSDSMPISYMAKLQKLPHVKAVLPFQWFGGVWRDPTRFFPNFATDPNLMWEVFPDFKATEEAKDRFRKERRAAVVGDELMVANGWKVGDRITLKGTIFPADMELEIVGSYHANFRSGSLLFRLDYLSEALGNVGTIGLFWVQADKAESIPGLIETIDGMFRNSPAETRTETEKAFVLGFLSMMGNIQLLLSSISIVILFTMLMVTASTMVMTIRERSREVAILKALGYPRRLVLILILGEAVFISLAGAVAGCVMALGVSAFNLSQQTNGMVERIEPAPWMFALALGVGAVVGVASGFAPALGASRMTILQGLRRID